MHFKCCPCFVYVSTDAAVNIAEMLGGVFPELFRWNFISATPPSRVLVIVPFWYVSLLSLYVLVISSMYMFHPVFFRTRFLLRKFFDALLNNLLFSRFSENTHRGGKCRSRRIGERLDIIAALRILFVLLFFRILLTNLVIVSESRRRRRNRPRSSVNAPKCASAWRKPPRPRKPRKVSWPQRGRRSSG